MPYSVPQQTANERGVEGLPQSLSRIHTTWYMPGNTGALNKQEQSESTWQSSLPFHMQTPAIAAATAQAWMSNPANRIQLPSNMEAADADGDGTINRDEFNAMMSNAGARADYASLFAQADADGDGELTAEELAKLADRNRNKFKATN